MLVHRILVVDDDKETERIAIREYKDIFTDLRKKLNLFYDIEIIWVDNIGGAINLLDQLNPFDVVVIDYDFANDEAGKKGVYLVKTIRETLNRRCKIVFYTMRAFHSFNKDELVDLLNNDVFRLIDKSGNNWKLKNEKFGDESDQIIVEAIIDAIDNLDPFSKALEEYLVKYYDILRKVKIQFEGCDYTIKEIINSIRLDGELGRKFISNIIEMSIIKHLDI